LLCSIQRSETQICLQVSSSDIDNSRSTWHCPGNCQPPHIISQEPEHKSHGTAACSQSCYTAYKHQSLNEIPFLALHIYSTPTTGMSIETITSIYTKHKQWYRKQLLWQPNTATDALFLCSFEAQQSTIINNLKFPSIQKQKPDKINYIRWDEEENSQHRFTEEI
jgi:hypothetical protein